MIPFAFFNQPNTVTPGGGGGGANLDLSNLVLSSGTLVPPFAAGTISYTVAVTNGVASIRVTPTTAGVAILTVNGSEVASGHQSGDIGLLVGSNPIVIKTDGGGGFTKSYTVSVNRAAASSNQAPNPSNLEYAFTNGNAGGNATVTMSNPNAQDMVVSFNVWHFAGYSWVTTWPQTIPAGSSIQVIMKQAGTIPANERTDTTGGTWSCGTESGILSAHVISSGFGRF